MHLYSFTTGISGLNCRKVFTCGQLVTVPSMSKGQGFLPNVNVQNAAPNTMVYGAYKL